MSFFSHELSSGMCDVKNRCKFHTWFVTTEFSGGSEGKGSPCNAGDLGSIPGLGRSTGEGHGNPPQYSCLETPKDRGTWQATVRGVAKSQTQLSGKHTHTHTHPQTDRQTHTQGSMGLPWWLGGKESACQCRRCWFSPWIEKIPWSRTWQPTPLFLPGESHERRSLAGCSSYGHQESDTTEQEHRVLYWRVDSLNDLNIAQLI